jgi:hypothetical protein
MPGDKLNGSTVIASVTYRDYPDTAYSVVLLNEQAPYYTVQILCPTAPGVYTVELDQDHENLVSAVIGINVNSKKLGYMDIGGDY